MNTAVNVNVVHEAEAQRQHARVRIPAKVIFPGPNREPVERSIRDLSAGGFSFDLDKLESRIGDFHQGRLQFLLDGMELGVDVEFQVRAVDTANGRAGCQFHNLRPREIATLRYLISAHLSGEMVSVGDLLNTLQRENFTKPRKQAGGSGMDGFARFRAVGFSLGIFLVGVAAFAYILRSVYGLYFVTHAESAQVAVPGMQVTMPREGTVQSLVQVGGIVEKGAPIASFSASMLEMLKGHLTEEQLDPENVEQLFGRQMKGTLTSPCTCRVSQQLVADGQFASKGAAIFDLVPQGVQATVEARFPYSDFAQATPGTRVSFQLAGEEEPRYGKIASTSLQNGGLSSDIRVVIQPETALDSGLSGQPVEVRIDHGPSLGGMVNKALAAAR